MISTEPDGVCLALITLLCLCLSCCSSLPADALDLLDCMLTLDPSKRITSAHALEHPFLKDVDVKQIAPPRSVEAECF